MSACSYLPCPSPPLASYPGQSLLRRSPREPGTVTFSREGSHSLGLPAEAVARTRVATEELAGLPRAFPTSVLTGHDSAQAVGPRLRTFLPLVSLSHRGEREPGLLSFLLLPPPAQKWLLKNGAPQPTEALRVASVFFTEKCCPVVEDFFSRACPSAKASLSKN